MAIAVAGAFALPLTSAASDTGASAKQEGANPRGQASPTGKGESATGATGKRGRFDALDKNHDGFISRDEAKDATELDTRFSELDVNNDGKLSRDEYNAVNASARGATGTGSMSGKSGGTSNTSK